MRKREKRDEVLLLAAVSGEIPADWMGEAAGSKEYGAALLTRLKRDGEIKLRSKDGIRGYLLRAKGKRYLLETYREDVEMFLSGSGATNHVKSEPDKRLRLHRMSMVWICFYRMGVGIFASDKPALFPGLYPSPYSSMGMGEESGGTIGIIMGRRSGSWRRTRKSSGSRACGILVGDEAFVVYNTMDSLMKWTPKIERNLRSRMEMRFRRFGEVKLYGAMMMGRDMDMLGRILGSDGGLKGNLYQVDETYEHIYFVPLVKEAAVQVRLLCSMEGREKLRTFLCGALSRVHENPFGMEAGTDGNGRKVYFCYLLELGLLRRIRAQGAARGGRVFCFYLSGEGSEGGFGGTV